MQSTCPQCGSPTPPRGLLDRRPAFCGFCGAALQAASAQPKSDKPRHKAFRLSRNKRAAAVGAGAGAVGITIALIHFGLLIAKEAVIYKQQQHRQKADVQASAARSRALAHVNELIDRHKFTEARNELAGIGRVAATDDPFEAVERHWSEEFRAFQSQRTRGATPP